MTLMYSKDLGVKLFDFEPQLNGDVLLRIPKYSSVLQNIAKVPPHTAKYCKPLQNFPYQMGVLERVGLECVSSFVLCPG